MTRTIYIKIPVQKQTTLQLFYESKQIAGHEKTRATLTT